METQHNQHKRVLHTGILAFAPIFLFTLWSVYYFIILGNFIVQDRLGEHLEIAGRTFQYYTPLFILFGVNFLVTLGAFLFFLWNIWTRPEVPSGNKVVWVVFLAAFNIIAFPVYWYMHIKHDFVRHKNASPALS